MKKIFFLFSTFCFLSISYGNETATSSQYILVTGGAGYIGSHACKILAQKGFIPIAYDNLSRGHREAVKWGPFIQGNLDDTSKLKKVMQTYHPIAVFHFAAFAYVGESVQAPLMYYSNNIKGTISLLEAMQECKIKTLIFSSSCATYGIPPEGHLIQETDEQHPINPYGMTKLMIEKIIQDVAIPSGMHYAILRYFNVAGSDPDLEIGECHDPETHLIPLALQSAANSKKTLTIFGTDYPTQDGTAIRDYIHVVDLVDAHVKAFEYLIHKQQNLILNLGTGKGCSVLDIVRGVEAVTGKKLKIQLAARREGDPPMLVANPKKSYELLHWSCRYSDLETILKTAWKWHKRKQTETAKNM